MEVPSKEVVGVVESIFGKLGAKILIGIIVVGAAFGALKWLYEGVWPYIPSSVPPWVSRLAVGVSGVALGWFVQRKLKELAELREKVEALPTHSDTYVDPLEQDKVRLLEDRVNYLESQVGDQLTNLLVGQTLKAQGIERGTH